MSDFGTFHVDRGLFDHPFFAPEPFTEREAWAWMCGRAARADGERRVGNLRIQLKRGQLAHSIRFLAKRWDWSHSRVQRFLARLVTESMIESVTESQVTCVTICNYDKYQLHPAPTDTAGESPPIQTKEESLPSTTESYVGGGGTRAREPVISEAAHQLAAEVMKTLEIDTRFVPPGWCGAALWFQMGLTSGWQPELVRIAAAKVRARRHYEPPHSYRYLGPPIDREHKLHAAPSLPIPPVVVRPQEQPHAQAQPASDWRARRDAQHAALDKLRAHNEAAGGYRGGEGGAEVVRMVPHARHGRS